MGISPEQWDLVKDLYESALDLDSDARSAFLRDNCQDPNLRAEANRLLNQHDKAGTFLSTPAMGSFPLEAEAPTEKLSEGQVLAGRFHIVRFIASGGMGEVYEAEDQELRERVAVKIIRPTILAQDNAVAQFKTEVHLARRVTHPNVCRIFDLFRHRLDDGSAQDETVFISMELLHGKTLETRLRESGRMSMSEALPLAWQMASALAAAHAVGIVHRDFKPGNVVLVEGPGSCAERAVVTDFGLALQSLRSDEGGSHSTGQGILGTPAYMSPEQIEGRPATAASDVYALGLVIYEMVTGARPFRGDTPIAAALKRLSETPTPPQKLQPELSGRWESLILRCLEREPNKRFPSAAEFARALEVDHTLETLPGPSLLLRQSKRLSLAIPVLLAIAAAGLVFWNIKPLPQPRIVDTHALTKTRNRKVSFTRPLVDRGSLYFLEERSPGTVTLKVSTAGGEVSEGPGANGDLDDISRDGSQLLFDRFNRARNQDDIWTQSFPTGVPRLVVKDAGNLELWSADGQSIFFDRSKENKTELYRANADGTGEEQLGTVPESVQAHLSPDGTHIRVTDTSRGLFTIWEVGADGHNGRTILGGRQDVWGGAWSPDGKYYFFASWDGERWSVWAASEAQHWWRRSETTLQQLSFGPMSIGVPAISNDGKQLYAAGTEPHGELSVYDRKSAKFIPYLGGISICYVDFSRDGQWMAYVAYPEGTLWRSRIDGSEKRQLTSPPLAVMNPRWSPDGKLIAFMDQSNGERRQMSQGKANRIYAISSDGGGPALLLSGAGFGDPTWSPDGNLLAYSYGEPGAIVTKTEVRILDLRTMKSTTLPGSAGMWSPRWSPDGRYLVAIIGPSAGPISRMTLFNFATNTWQELIAGGGGWDCWSRDSKFVYAWEGDSIVRIAIADHKKEQIASLQGFQSTAYLLDRWNAGWFGLTPDGRPISTRDTGISEIYALDLEYK